MRKIKIKKLREKSVYLNVYIHIKIFCKQNRGTIILKNENETCQSVLVFLSVCYLNVAV